MEEKPGNLIENISVSCVYKAGKEMEKNGIKQCGKEEEPQKVAPLHVMGVGIGQGKKGQNPHDKQECCGSSEVAHIVLHEARQVRICQSR